MKRNAFSQLVTWKNDPERKPLIIRGARQVGKTWLMKEFGQSCYESYVYFNFDEEDELKSIFEANKNPRRIIELLSMIAGEKILPGKTLVIFDEVQECPEALNTLKYFKEKANEYHVVAAGSLLGTLLAQPKSYPVGMVNLLDLYPLYFDEFLEATDPALFAYYKSIQKNQTIEEIFHNRLLEACNNYLIIGGMPECVASWVNHKDPAAVSRIQRELVEIYENGLSTALSGRADGRGTLKRPSNGLSRPVCSTASTTSPRWNIPFPPLISWTNSSCLSLIPGCLSTWRALTTALSC